MSRLAILGGNPVRSKPFSAWPRHLAADAERLQKVLDSRHWGGFPVPSKYAGEFAGRFAEMHGARYGLCLTSGTIALVVALQAAGVKFGDEVIVPSYTWEGTATAVLFVGGVPVFADVDPDTYCLDVDAVRKAITRRTTAVIPVHLAMRFADMDALVKVARKHKLKIIEDCAHAHGGQYKGRGAGSMGDIGCFSFQESKLMTAGEGGLVLTSDLACFEAMQSVVNGGRASLTDQYARRMLGCNYRMTELQAALLIGQLDMLPELAALRARHAALLTEALSSCKGVRPLPRQPAITRDTLCNYVFQYRPSDQRVHRDLFVAALKKEGIPCDGRFYEPVYKSDLFYATPDNSPQLRIGRPETMRYDMVHSSVAERAAYEEAVWLPQFLLIGDEADVRDVHTAIRKVLDNLDELAQADLTLAGSKAVRRQKSEDRSQEPDAIPPRLRVSATR